MLRVFLYDNNKVDRDDSTYIEDDEVIVIPERTTRDNLEELKQLIKQKADDRISLEDLHLIKVFLLKDNENVAGGTCIRIGLC